MKSSEPFRRHHSEKIKTSTLIYDRYTGMYWLCIPRMTEERVINTYKLKCGIDPGIRTFLTTYSSEECREIGTDISFQKYYDKIDSLNHAYNIGKLSNKSRRRAVSKVYSKIKRKVKDMHFKVAKYLCESYNDIRIGHLKTQQLVNNETSKLSKANKRKLMSLSHFSFRKTLESQAEKYGVDSMVVSEYMTTQTCSRCGCSYKVGKSKVYRCPTVNSDGTRCGLVADRDMNAAKNIRYMLLPCTEGDP